MAPPFTLKMISPGWSPAASAALPFSAAVTSAPFLLRKAIAEPLRLLTADAVLVKYSDIVVLV